MASDRKKRTDAGDLLSSPPSSPSSASSSAYSPCYEREHGSVASPGGVPLPSASAESTASNSTVRGSLRSPPMLALLPTTPSFPFPSMVPIVTGTPLGTPGFHKPFTALSPTVEPISRLAKRAKLAEEFKATRPLMRNVLLSSGQNTTTDVPASPPNLLDIAVLVQSEPGLSGFWSGLMKALRNGYGAERASLAVPSDLTDIENVPWAQLATWHAGEDDIFSRLTNEPQSNRSDLTEMSAPLEDRAPPSASSGQRSLGLASRPKPESRHSYAGYPSRTRGSSITPKRPVLPRETSHVSLEEGKSVPEAPQLSEELLERHDQAMGGGGSLSDVRSMNNLVPARILHVVQSLESEADPLVTSIGVVRLLNRGTSVVLTREYSAAGEKATRRRMRWTAANSPYEDFEQIPQSPWLKSPAPSPSPSAHTDSDENPFFANIDESAFDEGYEATTLRTVETPQIRAIGLDPRSASIIQVPLVHPSAALSQNERGQRRRLDSRSNLKPHGGEKLAKSLSMSSKSNQGPESSDCSRKHPIAILSLLVPVVPYPSYLVDSLNDLAPLLAAAFFTARQHTNLIAQAAALSRTREHLSEASSMGLRDASEQKPAFSSASAGSAASVSDDAETETSSALGTPAWVTPSHEPAPRSPRTIGAPTLELNDSYFSSKRPKSLLSSRGASFQATSPAMPTVVADMEKPARGKTREPSLSMLKTMIDNGATQQFVAEADNGSIVWVNAKFLAYRNSSGLDLQDEWWNSIYPKELRTFRKEWHKAISTGDQFAHSLRLRRFDGQHRWFHVRILPIKDRHGGIKYWHGQAMDIHDQHEAEQNATKSKVRLASEAKYRAIANSLPVIVFAAHVPSGMTFANTQWLTYSGQTLAESLGFGFLDHVHPDDLNKCRFPGFEGRRTSQQSDESLSPRAPLLRYDSTTSSNAESEDTILTDATAKPARTRSNERPSEFGLHSALLRGLADDGIIICAKDGQGNLSITTDMRLKSKTGEYRWHLVQGCYMESVNFGQGEAQWFIACTDITNQKLSEAKIQEANTALEEANGKLEKEIKAKMAYLSSISHEIRTPLNGIIGNLQFLIDSGLEQEAGQWAHGAQDAAKSLHELINDVLDLSKADANMLQLSVHNFSPHNVTEQVLAMLTSKAAEKYLEVSAETDERVPNELRGDSSRIRQVLLNLVGNAIKFTGAGGEIWVTCDILPTVPSGVAKLGCNERFVRWRVSDTGKGFTHDDKKLLFKEYSQIKRKNTRDIGGTGLGLILCKTMVDLHGGKIDATSEPGVGSVFTFFARFKLKKEPKKSGDSSRLQTPTAKSESDETDPKAAKMEGGTGRRRPSLAVQYAHNKPLSAGNLVSALESPSLFASIGAPAGRALPGRTSSSPIPRVFPSATVESPALLSDASSIGSPGSLQSQLSLRSLRSSVSTLDSASMKLSLPKPTIGTSQQNTVASGTGAAHDLLTADLERANFRPPILSVLIFSPLANTRRITTNQIKSVVPRSVPCQLTAEDSITQAMGLLCGDQPVTFTHVVVRTTSDADALRFVNEILESKVHQHTCLVLVTEQSQLRVITEKAKDLDIKNLSANDRLKILMKPCHTWKMAKIFDPFNENAVLVEDPLQAKRQEEKRQQKESYALFKSELGKRKLRILAVEDNKVQMDILVNFLGRICGLDVIQARNGKECLDLVFSHNPLYYSVILSDVEMPVMGGHEMVRAIRDWERKHKHPHVPIVSLSAHTLREAWAECSDVGFTHYCSKPVNFRDLGYILLDITGGTPHVFLRDRPLPRELASKEEDSSSEESEEEGEA